MKSAVLISCFAFIGLAALDVMSFLWSGYVLSVLWDWFAVSTFGLPAISVAQAIGISTVAGVLTYQAGGASGLEALASKLSYVFVMPGTMLLAGWIVKGYLP